MPAVRLRPRSEKLPRLGGRLEGFATRSRCSIQMTQRRLSLQGLCWYGDRTRPWTTTPNSSIGPCATRSTPPSWNRTVPPTADETATALGVSPDDVRSAYERLNSRHALFLTPGSHDVRMAHPFSGVPTAFRVESAAAPTGRTARGTRSASRPRYTPMPASKRRLGTASRSGLRSKRDECKGWHGVVHFPLPFRRWYDDLIET